MKSCCVFIVWISASVCLALRPWSCFLFQGNATVIPHREEDAYFHQVLKAMDILGISVSYLTSRVFYKLWASDVFFNEMLIFTELLGLLVLHGSHGPLDWTSMQILLRLQTGFVFTSTTLIVNEQFCFFCSSWKHLIEYLSTAPV